MSSITFSEIKRDKQMGFCEATLMFHKDDEELAKCILDFIQAKQDYRNAKMKLVRKLELKEDESNK